MPMMYVVLFSNGACDDFWNDKSEFRKNPLGPNLNLVQISPNLLLYFLCLNITNANEYK
jgi:hypothetical protein